MKTQIRIPVSARIVVDNGRAYTESAEYITTTPDELARALIELNGGRIPGTNEPAVL